MKKQIGVSTVYFTQKGMVRAINFKPTMEIDCSGPKLTKLKDDLSMNCKPIDQLDYQKIKEVTDLTMAIWFSAVNELEMRDHEKTKIESVIVSMEHFKGSHNRNKLRMIEIKYWLKK